MPPYLKLQRLRTRSTAEALVATRSRLGGVSPTHPAVPWLYADSLLEADDEFGARDGLVVQGDGVTWEALDALFDLAVAGMRAHRTETGHGGDPGCGTCRKFNAVFSVPIAEPIRKRRGLTEAVALLAPRQ